jgi:hypothetical protein
MKELMKRLKEAQKQGCEFIAITQVTQWIYDIQHENRLKAYERRQNKML